MPFIQLQHIELARFGQGSYVENVFANDDGCTRTSARGTENAEGEVLDREITAGRNRHPRFEGG
jgi:hypothetical protein